MVEVSDPPKSAIELSDFSDKLAEDVASASAAASSGTPKRARADAADPTESQEEAPKRIQCMSTRLKAKWEFHSEQLLTQHTLDHGSVERSHDELVEWVRGIARGKIETADKMGAVWVELQKRQAMGKDYPNVDVCLKSKGPDFTTQVLSDRVVDKEKLFTSSMAILALAMVVPELDFSDLKDDSRAVLLPLTS
jgi:hypothetical protein